MNKELEQFYNDNQDWLEDGWSEYLIENDWGSGEDKIKISEDMFWEWVETQLELNK